MILAKSTGHNEHYNEHPKKTEHPKLFEDAKTSSKRPQAPPARPARGPGINSFKLFQMSIGF